MLPSELKAEQFSAYPRMNFFSFVVRFRNRGINAVPCISSGLVFPSLASGTEHTIPTP